jgi:MFS family permease
LAAKDTWFVQFERPQSRIFYGWVIVATAAVGLLFGAFPISVASFGIFFPAYVTDFHARRSAISLAFTTHNLVAAFSTFVIGRLADRFGARTVILTGSAALGAILISARVVGSQLWQLYLLYGLLAAAGAATTSVPYALVVSRWFNRRRGLALGLMMIGMGMGAILVPLLAQRLITAHGWRAALAIFGCLVLAVSIPIIAIFFKESPQQAGLLPDGALTVPKAALSSQGLSWHEIRLSGTFWLMTVAFVLVGASVHACIIHLPQLIADRQGSLGGAALATSVLGIALLLGRAGTGYFLDRHFAPRVASLVFASAAVGVLLIWLGGRRPLLLLGGFLVGLAFGAEADIIAYLVGRYFGLRSLGVAVGFTFGAFVLAGGTGPLLMDFAFDRSGSYAVPLAASFLLTLLAAALLTRLGPYRFGANGDF